MKLEQGKSYIWLFPIYAVLFAGGFALCDAFGHFEWGGLTMPAFMIFMLISELRSGVAIDSWWRASYPKGCSEYRMILGWQVFGTVGMLVLACIVLFSFH